MSTLDSGALPPTLIPIFDAGNRLVAARASFAANIPPNPGLLAELCSADDSIAEDEASFRLPLLFETADPQWWVRTLAEVPAPYPGLYLQFPAACFAEAESQTALAELETRSVTLMARGIPADTRFVQAIGMDAASGVDGPLSALLQKLSGPHLASGLDSHEAHRLRKQAGFHWFEGGWLLHPEAERTAQNTTARGNLMKMLGLLSNDADSHDIESLLKHDPNLSYQLLKLVNSVSFAPTHKISNINQAITLLGRRQLQRWLQLLLFAGHHANGTIGILLGFAAHRAALMEALTEATGGKRDVKDRAFMVGLFSLLDILLNTPLADLITPLHLDDEISTALIAHEGPLGALLDLATATESTPSETLATSIDALKIPSGVFIRTQLKAMLWAAQVCREVG